MFLVLTCIKRTGFLMGRFSKSLQLSVIDGLKRKHLCKGG